MSQGPFYYWDPGTRTTMCKELMCPDPYESNCVFVKVSRVKGGGEGLFAKVDLPPKRVISFYNGFKMTSEEIVRKYDFLNHVVDQKVIALF
jgi:hypothetical protein